MIKTLRKRPNRLARGLILKIDITFKRIRHFKISIKKYKEPIIYELHVYKDISEKSKWINISLEELALKELLEGEVEFED